MSILRLKDDSDIDEMVEILEDRIEDAHSTTVDEEATDEEKDDAKRAMLFAKKFLRQIDEENPILSAHVKAGVAFDWEKFWSGLDEEDEEEGDDDEEPSLASRLADEMAHEVEVIREEDEKRAV